MVEKSKKSEQAEEANDPGLVSKVLKWSAYPFAAVAGFWTGKKNIFDAAYARYKEKGGFDDLYHGFDSKTGQALSQEAAHKIVEDFKQGVKPAGHIVPGSDTLNRMETHTVKVNEAAGNAHLNHGFPERIDTIDNTYKKQVTQRLKSANLGSFSKQLKYVHDGHHQTALLNGLTIGSIVLVAVLTMAESKAISHLMAKKDKEKEAETGRST